MIKKIFALLLCVLLVIPFSSCTDEKEKSQSNKKDDINSAISSMSENENSESEILNESDLSDSSIIEKEENDKTESENKKNNSGTTASKSSSSKKSTSSKKNTAAVSSNKTSSQSSSKVTSSSSGKLNVWTQPSVKKTALSRVSESNYYGYKTITDSNVKKAYNYFKTAVANYSKEVNFDFNISENQVRSAYELYRDDYPQHFWRGVKFALYTDSKTKNAVKFEFLDMLDKSKATSLKSTVDSKCKNILSKLSGSMSEIDRERIIHDEIIKLTSYNSSDYAHNMAGVFVSNHAVCEGYTAAFQYLMREAGIQCISVKGTRAGENHVWNMALIGGAWYHVDLTTDDPVITDGSPIIDFDDFNVTDTDIKKSHTISGNVYKLPSATATKYNFYKYYGLEFKNFTIDNFATSFAFSANNGYVYAYLKFTSANSDDALNFVGKNYKQIITRANTAITSKKLKVPGSNDKISLTKIAKKYHVRNTCTIKLDF